MNPRQLSITVIGSGNVAWHIARKLYACGFVIKAIVGRNYDKAKALADSVRAKAVDDFKHIPDANVYILSLKDDVYTSVVSSLPKSSSIYLHTSGSLEIDILKRLSPNYGVLYPFQTFSKGKDLNFSQIPFCLESSNFFTKEILMTLAEQLSEVHHWLTSQQRKQLHLAGVFASNFPNALYVIVKQILDKQKMDFSIALPLIKETVEKLDSLYPEEAQTGPAVRNDTKVIEKHIDMLSEPDYKITYELLTKIIQKQQNTE